MTPLNRALTRRLRSAHGAARGMPPMAGLVLLSLATAVAVLLAFKWTADQPALAAAKQAMQAAIFEMRLFNDDLVLLFRAQGEVLRHSLTYLRLSLAPTLWLIVPMAGADAAHGVSLRLRGTGRWRGGTREGEARRIRRERIGDAGGARWQSRSRRPRWCCRPSAKSPGESGRGRRAPMSCVYGWEARRLASRCSSPTRSGGVHRFGPMRPGLSAALSIGAAGAGRRRPHVDRD